MVWLRSVPAAVRITETTTGNLSRRISVTTPHSVASADRWTCKAVADQFPRALARYVGFKYVHGHSAERFRRWLDTLLGFFGHLFLGYQTVALCRLRTGSLSYRVGARVLRV